jgi:hypothetical protein
VQEFVAFADNGFQNKFYGVVVPEGFENAEQTERQEIVVMTCFGQENKYQRRGDGGKVNQKIGDKQKPLPRACVALHQQIHDDKTQEQFHAKHDRYGGFKSVEIFYPSLFEFGNRFQNNDRSADDDENVNNAIDVSADRLVVGVKVEDIGNNVSKFIHSARPRAEKWNKKQLERDAPADSVP